MIIPSGIIIQKLIYVYVHVDGTEINGERNVTICGTPETVE